MQLKCLIDTKHSSSLSGLLKNYTGIFSERMQKHIVQSIECDRDKVLQLTISESFEMIVLLDKCYQRNKPDEQGFDQQPKIGHGKPFCDGHDRERDGRLLTVAKSICNVILQWFLASVVKTVVRNYQEDRDAYLIIS